MKRVNLLHIYFCCLLSAKLEHVCQLTRNRARHDKVLKDQKLENRFTGSEVLTSGSTVVRRD